MLFFKAKIVIGTGNKITGKKAIIGEQWNSQELIFPASDIADKYQKMFPSRLKRTLSGV